MMVNIAVVTACMDIWMFEYLVDECMYEANTSYNNTNTAISISISFHIPYQKHTHSLTHSLTHT